MFRNGQQGAMRFGEYDYGNGRRGRHPLRRRIAPGAPLCVQRRALTNQPVEATAREDALYGDRERTFQQQLADLEVWD